jgi:hypothetical protein
LQQRVDNHTEIYTSALETALENGFTQFNRLTDQLDLDPVSAFTMRMNLSQQYSKTVQNTDITDSEEASTDIYAKNINEINQSIINHSTEYFWDKIHNKLYAENEEYRNLVNSGESAKVEETLNKEVAEVQDYYRKNPDKFTKELRDKILSSFDEETKYAFEYEINNLGKLDNSFTELCASEDLYILECTAAGMCNIVKEKPECSTDPKLAEQALEKVYGGGIQEDTNSATFTISEITFPDGVTSNPITYGEQKSPPTQVR